MFRKPVQAWCIVLAGCLYRWRRALLLPELDWVDPVQGRCLFLSFVRRRFVSAQFRIEGVFGLCCHPLLDGRQTQKARSMFRELLEAWRVVLPYFIYRWRMAFMLPELE